MSCAEYWESVGVDPLDGALTVGCRNLDGAATGFDWGALLVVVVYAIAITFFLRANTKPKKAK